MGSLTTSSLLFQLIQWKKRQASLLFAAWDIEDEGRIPLMHLRPLLCSLFPEPLDPSKGQAAQRQRQLILRHREALMPSRVRQAFYRATQLDPSPSSGSPQSSSPIGAGTLRRRTSFTLNELHATIDCLCQYDWIQRQATEESRNDDTANKTVNIDQVALSPQEMFGCATIDELDDDNDNNPTEGDHSVSITDCDAFILLLGELERVYCECVLATQESPSLLPASAIPLKISPVDVQRITSELLGRSLSHHEARAVSNFFCSAFEAPGTFNPSTASHSPRTLQKTHFLAAVLGVGD